MTTGNHLEEFGDLTDEQRLALEMGDPEAMASLFGSSTASEGGDKTETVDTENNTDDTAIDAELDDVATATAAAPKQEPAAPAEGAPSGAESDAGKFVETKDGKHRIPYQVLEDTRQQAADYKQRFEELSQKSTTTEQEKQELQRKFDQLSRKVELLSGQVTKSGMTPAQLPEEIQLTDEMLEELSEYGEAGKALQVVFQKIRALESNTAASTPKTEPTTTDTHAADGDVPSPVDAAIAKNADLTAWQKGDPDRWDQACRIDERLQTDPVWKTKSFDERFAEAARRTKVAFGDSVETPKADARQVANNKIAAADDAAAAPKTLTDLGRADSKNEKTKAQHLASITSEDELLEEFGELSLDDLDKVWAEISE